MNNYKYLGRKQCVGQTWQQHHNTKTSTEPAHHICHQTIYYIIINLLELIQKQSVCHSLSTRERWHSDPFKIRSDFIDPHRLRGHTTETALWMKKTQRLQIKQSADDIIKIYINI